MTITFNVDKVEARSPAKLWSGRRQELQFIKQGLASAGLKGDTIEAFKFNADEKMFYDVTHNSFVCTALDAFNAHHSFAMSPDDVWLLCAQAITKHIALNPEDCRKVLVSWEGKKTITVFNNDFMKGSPDNNWEREFKGFAHLIQKHIGKKADLFDPTFSTTGPTEKAAIQVQMMAALAPYFEYRMMTLCGVPTVTLLGTPEDWSSIVGRVSAFGEFYPKWAHDPMMKAVTAIANSSRGNHDMDFWQNFFKTRGGSGGTPVNGWITAFFPYMKKSNEPNKLMQGDFQALINKGAGAGYDLGDFPSSVGSVPMQWDCRGAIYDMALATGIFGATIIDVDFGVRAFKPVIGWAVGEARAEK